MLRPLVFALVAFASITPAAAAEIHGLLAHDGLERGYVLVLPDQPAGAAPLPLVIVLHGGGGNAANAIRMTGFADLALAAGFAAVFPEGTGRTALLTWNAGHCCSYAMRFDVDDVGFVAALIDALGAGYPIDRDRIYVTGMSNGAMMTHRLGIELGDRLAAIAPVVGGLFGDEPPPVAPVPAIIFNGALDRSVPVEGGATGNRFAGAWDGTPLLPAAAQGGYWAAAAGCAAGETESGATATLERYQCPPGAAVESWLILDQGHAWPGGEPGTAEGDRPSPTVDATAVIWDFFSRHSLADRRPPLP